MIKVLSIFGTRPEAIKMAPVIKELEKHPLKIISRICVTAQHREMLDQILTLFKLTPDYDLNLMRPNQTLAQITASILTELTPIIQAENPDWLLVQGDTTTVMAAALAAFYLGVKVGHVEAGLRTGDKHRPFPEEINRRIAGVMADVHFSPTAWARDNLLAEKVPPEQIVVTGNTVIDALQWVSVQPLSPETQRLGPLDLNYVAQEASNTKFILVTAHRRESFGQPFEEICQAIKEIALHYSNQVHIFYPVHLNPNVQEPVNRLLGTIPNITLLPPLEYLPLVHLMKHCYLILTDSGGIQEEAPGLGKPVLVLREVTERPEGVAAGTVKLVGTNRQRIVEAVDKLLNDPSEYQRMAQAVNPYGDGHAAERIVGYLLQGSNS